MNYNFDEVIDRTGTGSVKWDGRQARFGSSDAIPLWVADMDFRSPEPVMAALRSRVEHGIYGYTMATDGYYQAMIDWLSRRQGWQVEREWISHAPGVVPGLGFLLLALTEPGDKVIIQTPVYYPFKRVIEAHGRTVLANPLQYKDGRYEMDLEDLARKVDDAKVLILSNPHNPVGRVWTREELEGLGDVCAEAGVVVISDEVHADLVFKPHRHTPFASISEKLAQNSVTCIAPSKTFNLAGFHTAAMITPNPELRKRYEDMLNTFSMNWINTTGAVALEAAFNHGDDWLDQVLYYLKENLDFLTLFFSRRMPEVKVVQPEGTYLVWLDFSALNLEPKQLDELMLKQAKVALDEGHLFGTDGTGFQRLNLACPRPLLASALEEMAKAVEAHR
ncbi:MAG: cystathionine beta-lyase [Alicyclobacillus sp. RIFOXYA1_FULL_53_8]|nr:MAG: cystathionine beta-lyase [Alicyclobacillus sp. RIFOXYA1_FULL_53_8]